MATLSNVENQDRIAKILIECVLTGDDDAVAAKYRISPRTIRRWRARVESDNGPAALVLAQTVQQKLNACNVDWERTALLALNSGMAFLDRAAREIKVTPQAIRAVAGAIKLVGELTAHTRFIDAKVSALTPKPALKAVG